MPNAWGVILGGGILCLKALPDLPQQGKREAELPKQQIVLQSRVKVNVDVEFQVHLSTGGQLSRRWHDAAGALTLKVLKAARLVTGAKGLSSMETTMTEFSDDVAGTLRCDDVSTGLNTSCGSQW